MSKEIGDVAGEIWKALDKGGETSYTALKKKLGVKAPLLDWAVGWLAREDKLLITKEKQTVRLKLK